MERSSVSEPAGLSEGFEEEGESVFVWDRVGATHFVEQVECGGGEIVGYVSVEEGVVDEGGAAGEGGEEKAGLGVGGGGGEKEGFEDVSGHEGVVDFAGDDEAGVDEGEMGFGEEGGFH